ncbi:MAG: biotin-dependent carboxyltransferase family protein [Cyclobacteriaceae bacterium]|nr:biotin-dependent carboxyltransferase family protein [Cyclobacteriaceae bacterium]
MTGFVEVISPGLYSSIQDRGRFGFRKYGVPVSGVMDEQSASLANHLLNNPLESALMEITMTGPKLLFSVPTQIVISGADISPQLNGVTIPLNKAIVVNQGDLLSFGSLRYGLRCYLAVKGGFQTERILNSRSCFAPVTSDSTIKSGDQFQIKHYNNHENHFSSVKVEESHFSSINLVCTKGPEFDLLNPKEKEIIFNTILSVSNDNNRMGYRLEGNAFQYPSDYNMLTSAVLPGTIQLTPSGNLIALMKDCQTTGGYPRILQLLRNGVNILAQKKATDNISFTPIDIN